MLALALFVVATVPGSEPRVCELTMSPFLAKTPRARAAVTDSILDEAETFQVQS